MPRSEKLEQAYRSFHDGFNLPHPGKDLDSYIDEMGGREGLQALLGSTPVQGVIDMIQSDDRRGLQRVVDELSEEIELAVKKIGLPLNVNYYAGEFPTGSFNAQARVVSDGILILVNTGLMIFIQKVSKLLMQSVQFAVDVENARPTSRAESGAMPYEDVVEAFAELILGYLSSEEAWFQRVRRIPAMTGQKLVLHAHVVNSCEKFVIAHEFGHAIAGHLSRPKTMTSRTPVGDVEFAYNSQAEEFEADRIAAMLLLGETHVTDTREQLYDVQCDVAGPFLFFALDQLITRVAMEIKGLASTPIVTDHPPSQQRMQAVREYYHRIASPEVTEIGDVYAQWIDKVGDDVMKSIEHLLPRNSGRNARLVEKSQIRDSLSPGVWLSKLRKKLGSDQRAHNLSMEGCASASRSAEEKLSGYLYECDISKSSILADLINQLLRESGAFGDGVTPHRIEDKAAAIIELTRTSSAFCKLFFECELCPPALRIAIPLTPSQLKYVCLRVGFEQTAAIAMGLKWAIKSDHIAMSKQYLNAIGSRDCDDAFKKVVNILEHDPKSCVDRFLKDAGMGGMRAVLDLIDKKEILVLPAGMEQVGYTNYKGNWFVDGRFDAKEMSKALSCLACRELMVPDGLIDDFLLQLEIDGRSGIACSKGLLNRVGAALYRLWSIMVSSITKGIMVGRYRKTRQR